MINSDDEVLRKGMECLQEKLGIVDVERFISLMNARHWLTDYTEWRQENLFKNMTGEEISKAAMEYKRKMEAAKKNK